MDPVSLVVAALAAGALAGVGDVAGQAIKDGYAGLKELVVSRLGGDDHATELVTEYQANPGAHQEPLRKELAALPAGVDQELISVASQVLELADPDGVRAGKYAVTVSGDSAKVVIGDGNNITMN
ncbi:MAG: hypothetical protein ACRCYU_00825 [Nocardioides sp.]